MNSKIDIVQLLTEKMKTGQNIFDSLVEICVLYHISEQEIAKLINKNASLKQKLENECNDLNLIK